jgi:heptosyltransferase III
MSESPSRIILVRRDNIGDLVCVTPLLAALRLRFPNAHIAMYVNSYHRDVLDGNPDLDAVHVYTKRKHMKGGMNPFVYYWHRARQIWAMRALHFDDIIVAEPAYSRRLARASRVLNPRRIIGFAASDGSGRYVDVRVPRGPDEEVASLHEVEDVFRLARVYGIEGPPPPVKVCSSASVANRAAWGVHISARKPSQRWPAERFAAVLRVLHAESGDRLRLFWAPGEAGDEKHPGDDQKSAAIRALVADLPVEFCPTPNLRNLIDGLAACDRVLCSDGGAMHLAAGLGKPIVCMFGRSNPVRWRPWGVPYRLLQAPSQDVADIGVEQVLAACRDLVLKSPFATDGSSVLRYSTPALQQENS